MNFIEKLDYQMKRFGLNKSKLSQLSGVPYTTIDGFYKKGYGNAKISTIKKIAAALDVSLDYLIDDDPEEAPAPPGDERSRIQAIFDQLTPANQSKLLELADLYLAAQRKSEENE